MKYKRILSLVLALVTVLSLAVPAFAASKQNISVSPIDVMVGGKVFLPTDPNGKNVPVFEYNGTTYAPLRALAEAYGLTVGYNKEKNLATVDGSPSGDFAGSKGTAKALTKKTTIAVSPINIEVGGKVFQPKDPNGKDVSVFVYEGTTYAPLRALAEAYGLTVGYNAQKNLATVEFVASNAVIWDGTVAQSFAKGAGVQGNPYVIETPQELARLAQEVNAGNEFEGKFFVLANDLNLADMEWTPIGTYRNGFGGHFDGAGHTVTGLCITKAEIENYGANYWHDSIECVGLFGLAEEESYIGNLSVDGKIDIVKTDAPERDDVVAGGIVGLTCGIVYNCHNACDISVSIDSEGTYINIGGVAGCYTWESSLMDSCTNTGTLYGKGIEVVRIGGVCGDNDGHGIVRNCVNFGKVLAECTRSNYSGGIVAHTANSAVYNCANYGSVQGPQRIGGIAGQQYGTDSFGGEACIINCVSIAPIVLGYSNTTAGAICGEFYYGTIETCYYAEFHQPIGRANELSAKDVVSCAGMSAEALRDALNAWVEENNGEEQVFNMWSIDAEGRVVPIQP